jgi:hypothetical protein
MQVKRKRDSRESDQEPGREEPHLIAAPAQRRSGPGWIEEASLHENRGQRNLIISDFGGAERLAYWD